ADLFGTYLVNLTMAQYYFRVPDIDLAYWTMVPEMIFYVFMLGLFQLNLLRKTELVGCCVLALCMLFCYLCQGTGFTQVTKVIRWGLPIVNYFPLFVAGISFYRIKHRQNTVFNVCLLPACLLVQILLYNNAVQMHFRTAFLTMTEYTGIIMAYFIIFVLFVCNALPFITNKITVFLGSISYSLYLVHAFISMNVLIPFAKAYLTSNYLLACAFSLAGVIIIATGVTYIVEKPAMRYIRARFNKLPAADISRTPVESKKNLKPLVEKVRNF
ncbi:MAG: rane protein, partial [Flavipsychrobacter sp.]|nr:rane protein [Flavipsychrobacter sp.]